MSTMTKHNTLAHLTFPLKIRSLLIVAALLMMAAVSPPAMAGDFDKGMTTYNRGDYAAALAEWRPLAEQGLAKAQHNLGLMYDKGWGVPEDDKEAVKWYRMAAEQGDASAQNNLGLMYAKGEGVPMDGAVAYMWFNIASTAGYQDALNNRNRVHKYLTPEQIAEGQRLSRQCINDLSLCP